MIFLNYIFKRDKMKNFKLKVIFLLAVLLSCCGFHEGVIESEQRSFIKFTGALSGAKVTVDGAVINVSNDNTVYEISPGKHNIQVRKNGAIKVNRNLLFGNGMTKEVKIP